MYADWTWLGKLRLILAEIDPGMRGAVEDERGPEFLRGVENRIDIKDYRVSAGFGFRFTVPMLGQVPIAFDFGFPIVKGADDREQIFAFWVGFSR